MRLAQKALAITTLILMSLIVASAQPTPRSENDDRNIAPTVGTGGPVGGPTGLFTIYDGQTLRRGEYTSSAAYSNFDRDPGNADITEVPVSFQVGVNDNLELFFNTDAYRGLKVNAPRNLSSFYLPNSAFRSQGAIVLAPTGPNASTLNNLGIYRPLNNQVFVQFPFVGGNAGSFGFPGANPGVFFGFASGFPIIGAPRAGGNGADLFPGVGSPFGSILPGVVLSTTNLAVGPLGGGTAPVVFSSAPSYLPDAPFANHTNYGESAFSTFSVGAKWRWTSPNNPVGVGIIPFYRFYADKADSASGWSQLQRGASPGGNRGDIGVVMFGDTRLRKWLNLSANIGYIYNSSVKGEFPTGTFTLLDRPDEVLAGFGVDMPVNKYFQLIGEARTTQYVGGRTPNAFENDPIDLLGGFRVYPTRWMSLGAWYRYHANQQDRDSFGEDSSRTVVIDGRTQTISTGASINGIPTGFGLSSDPHGFGMQATIGRRNSRGAGEKKNSEANVDGIEMSDTEVHLPCAPGTVPKSGEKCDAPQISVRTKASDADGDTLIYNYTVSGGRIVGQGANVTWDLSSARPGTYTITAAVDDGCGACGKTKTETVTVKDCECYKPCDCASLSVSGPGSTVPVGEKATFTANLSGGSCTNERFNWTVSSGEIVSGQGTPVIMVSAAQGADVTATVETTGCCEGCPTTASASASFEAKPVYRKTDEFGKEPNDVIRGKLDQFFIDLQNDPGAAGVIINYGTAKEKAARLKLINNHIAFRSFPADRIIMVDGGAEAGIRTQFFVVPAGADMPQPGM